MGRNIETSDEPGFPAALYPQPWHTNKRWLSLPKANTLLRFRYSQYVLDTGMSCEILPRNTSAPISYDRLSTRQTSCHIADLAWQRLFAMVFTKDCPA